MTDDQNSFDPRFDPAFQRGFDGPTPAVSTPAPARQVGPPPVAPETFPERAVTASRVLGADANLPEIADESAGRTRNPFLIALTVLAVVLVGLGLYLFQATRVAFLAAQNSNGGDYFSMQTVVFAAPLCIALGVATGIGVLFVYATRHPR